MIHTLNEDTDLLAPAQPEELKQTTTTLDKIQLLLIEYLKETGVGLDYATAKSKDMINAIILYNKNS